LGLVVYIGMLGFTPKKIKNVITTEISKVRG